VFELLQINYFSTCSTVKFLTTVFCFSAAVSFMVAEQFGEAIEMEAITRAAKYGRMTGKNNDWD
jgi:hypothetical protein